MDTESRSVVYPIHFMPPMTINNSRINGVSIVSHDAVLCAVHDRQTTIIDVRTHFEVETFGKIPNSVLLPVDDIDYAMQLTEEDFELEFGFPKPCASEQSIIIIYCRSGARAKLAANALRDTHGFNSVSVYEASWLEWEKRHPEDVKKIMPQTVEGIRTMMADVTKLKKRRWFGKK